jgi:hypothetical protein
VGWNGEGGGGGVEKVKNPTTITSLPVGSNFK